jgi:hypothetical protein
MFGARKVAMTQTLRLAAEIDWLRKAGTVREVQMGKLEAQYGEALSRLAEFDNQDKLVRKAMR